MKIGFNIRLGSGGGVQGSAGPTASKNCAGQITLTGGGPAAPSVTKNNAGQITAVGA